MNIENNLIIYKELKILFERKKIFLYFIAGIIFPTIMQLVFMNYGSIFPIEQSVIFMFLFVAMLSSEFLFMSLAEETNYNMLNILIIGSRSKVKLFVSKSVLSIIFTLIITIFSASFPDLVMYFMNITTSSLLRVDLIVICFIAMIVSLLGEWICMLYIGEYNVNSHSIIMIISCAIVLGIFYLKSILPTVSFAMITIVFLLLYSAIVIHSLKLKDTKKNQTIYFKNLFSDKRISYIMAENLVVISELRKINFLTIKLLFILILPVAYIVIIQYFSGLIATTFSGWIIMFIIISFLCNATVFSNSFNSKKNGTEIIYKIRKKNNMQIIFTRLISYLLILLIYTMLLFVIIEIFGVNYPKGIYILLMISGFISYFICSVCGMFVNNIKEFKMINLLYILLSLMIHILLFALL